MQYISLQKSNHRHRACILYGNEKSEIGKKGYLKP